MNRLKLLAAIALLGLPLAACEEATLPPPVGSIMGQVSIEGQGIDGVSVTLSNGATTSTAGGNYRFDNVEGGTYTVSISGFPADASFDATSATATIGASGETATVNFSGSYIRTASVIGTVTVEDKGLVDVTVRLTGMAEATTATNDEGYYAFTGLRAGTYGVEISGFESYDVSFSKTVVTSVTVDLVNPGVVNFEGTYLRTAGIMGQVRVDGEGLPGVTVSLSGGEEDATTMTDDSGQYAFSKLRAGVYSVGISGYDTDAYEFKVTSRSKSVALGETGNVSFEGNLLRTAGISGRVSVEGAGIAEVTVTLSGAGDASTTTNAGGQYGFAGLVEGDYTVAISGYDENAYSFETESAAVTVGDSESKIQNFGGSHTTTASISGQMFIDWTGDGMFNAGNEDPFAQAGIPVALQGPGVNDLESGLTGADGSYMFGELTAGAYRVLMDPTNAAAASLVAAGLQYGGSAAGVPVEVAAAGSATANFPFDITHQTITVKAMLGDNGVEGVGIDLYATFQDAEGGTTKLGSDKTDATGTASVTFARAADVGPAGTPDQLVFSKVSDVPNADQLSVTENATMEVSYAKRYQTAAAPESVSLMNKRANVRFWVKNISTGIGGDEVQKGWTTEARFYADPDSAAMDGTKSDASGMSSFTGDVDVGDLPKTYYLSVGGPPSNPNKETWDATAEPYEGVTADGKYLMYVHDGLQMPGETADLGTMRVKWTTQTLVVGAHRERDQEEGYATYDILKGGDVRPAAGKGGSFELMISDTNGRLRTYEVASTTHDPNKNGNPRDVGAGGLATFKNLPSDMNFTVRYTVEADRKIVGDTEVDTWRYQGDNSVGAFGDDGGTGNTVQLCPLAPDATKTNCSTTAYIWTDGTVSGAVTSKDYNNDKNGDLPADSLDVRLTPSGNLSSGGGGSTKSGRVNTNGGYEFTNVPDGVYNVSVTGSNKWGDGADQRVHVNRPDETGGGFKLDAMNFLLTYINTSISGTVVNDTDGNGRVTGADAAEAGVELTLFKATSKGKKGGTAGMTAMTDASGAFSFTGVTEGSYIVVADGGDYFVSSGETVGTQSPVLKTTAMTTSFSSGTGMESLPMWIYETSKVDNKKDDADFILLYEDGEISGKVEEGTKGVETDVEVYICATAVKAGAGEQCKTYGNKNRPVDTKTTNAKGEYVFEGLREGYYEVSPRVPAGKSSTTEVVLVSGREDSQPGVDFVIK